MSFLLLLIADLIDLYVWVVIIGAVMSWLIAFNVINMSNRFVQAVYVTCQRLTEPALQPLRNILPPVSGVDLSPILLLVGLSVIKSILVRMALQAG